VKITNADLQALLWYYEKNLWKKLGYSVPRAEPADYADGARSLLAKHRGEVDSPVSAMAAQPEKPESPWFSGLKNILGMGKPKDLEEHQDELRSNRSRLARQLPEKMAVSSEPVHANNINEVHKVKLNDGSTGYFKPDPPQEDWKYIDPIHYSHGTQTQREWTAYQLAETLGLHDLVPATAKTAMAVHGTGKTVPGSIQEEAKGKKGSFEGIHKMDDDTLAKVALFDLITANHDRHFGNWVQDKHNHPHLIDNGFAFPDKDTKIHYKRFVDHFLSMATGHTVPEVAKEWAAKMDQVAAMLKQNGMSDSAVAGVVRRLEAVGQAAGKKIQDISFKMDDGKVFRANNIWNDKIDPRVWEAEFDPDAKTDTGNQNKPQSKTFNPPF
jgi:hypothetical protein